MKAVTMTSHAGMGIPSHGPRPGAQSFAGRFLIDLIGKMGKAELFRDTGGK